MFFFFSYFFFLDVEDCYWKRNIHLLQEFKLTKIIFRSKTAFNLSNNERNPLDKTILMERVIGHGWNACISLLSWRRRHILWRWKIRKDLLGGWKRKNSKSRSRTTLNISYSKRNSLDKTIFKEKNNSPCWSIYFSPFTWHKIDTLKQPEMRKMVAWGKSRR